jgi:hypothetical protein
MPLESTYPSYMSPESTDLQSLDDDTTGIGNSPNGLLGQLNNNVGPTIESNDADSAPVLGGSPA